MAEFRMPALGADMEAGTLVEWRVRPGERVQAGDIVAVVETQKGAIEVEIFQDGIVESLLVEPGREVPVGTPLALVRGAGEAAPQPLPQARARISPAARRRAGELGVELAGLAGTGPAGAVTLADVERAAARPTAPAAVVAATAPVEPAAAPPDRATAMRRAIAAAMARAKREIPHYYLAATFSVEPALAWLEAENARRPLPERILPAALLLKATALALRAAPELNGTWSDGGFRPGSAIHLGVAVFLRGGGLVAPALPDADRLDLGALMSALRDLVARARAGGLRAAELSQPTITVTSLGEQGVETVLPVIIPPQVAIVGFGSIVVRPWVDGGAIVPRRVVTASLAADHRASDGHRGAAFLQAVGRLLQQPEQL